jgi:uncharacterized membrane protein
MMNAAPRPTTRPAKAAAAPARPPPPLGRSAAWRNSTGNRRGGAPAAAAASAAAPAAPAALARRQRRRPSLPPPSAAAAATATAATASVSFDSLATFGLFPASGLFGVWAMLALAGAFGRWAEHRTQWGRELSGALVATLAGMLLSNVGVVPHGCPELAATFRMLVPIAVPLLLLAADLRRILRETGRLLACFLLGALCTALGTLLAAAVLPLGGALGDGGWRVAAALLARHIGGAVNYVAVSGALEVPPSLFGAGLAADDLILTCYFAAIYALARKVPAEKGEEEKGGDGGGGDEAAATATPTTPTTPTTAPPTPTIAVYEGTVALSLSVLLCHLGTQLAAALGAPSQALTAVTALSVAAATLFPQRLAPLAPSGEGLAAVIMQTFFAAVGASADVGLVVRSAPVLFAFSAVAIAAHLALLLLIGGRVFGFSRRELLLSSNACVGGPSTVAGMAQVKGWKTSLVPAVLVSTLGYALGSVVGLATGHYALRPMMMVGGAA